MNSRPAWCSVYFVLAGVVLSLVVAVTPAQAAWPVTPPTNVHGVSRTQVRIQIAWDGLPSDYHQVMYSPRSDFSNPKIVKPIQGTAYTLTKLTPGTTYYFRVGVTDASGNPRSDWSATAVYATRPLMRISVGTYNVHNPNRTSCSTASSKPEDWCNRAPWVAYGIVTEGLQALGIQEAYQPAERRDLLNRVNARISGADPWAMAPDPDSDVGYDNRIMFDTRYFTLVQSGGKQYDYQLRCEDSPRWFAWAHLKHLRSGRELLYVTTHLQPSGCSDGDGLGDYADGRQWDELIYRVNKLKATYGIPHVIVAGDFNTSRFESPASGRITKMRTNGYGDVLGQQYQTNATSGARAQVRKDAWLNSGNKFKTKVICSGSGRNANCASNRTLNGFSVDWIFASNDLKVPYYRHWVRWSSYPNTWLSPIPSDHHLVRAIISQ